MKHYYLLGINEIYNGYNFRHTILLSIHGRRINSSDHDTAIAYVDCGHEDSEHKVVEVNDLIKDEYDVLRKYIPFIEVIK